MVRTCVRGGACAGALAGVLALMGCQATQMGDRTWVSPARAAPDVATMIERYNRNAERLSRVFIAAGDVRIRLVGSDGAERTEQAEFSMQMVAPSNLAIFIRKLSQTLFVLGCNQERYWWVDVSGDEKFVATGLNSLAWRVKRGPTVGLRIRPTDIVRLIGAVPIAADGSGTADSPQARWSSDGKNAILTIPHRATDDQLSGDGAGDSEGVAFERITMDATTGWPSRVELLDRAGVVIVESELSAHGPVDIRASGAERPRLAQSVFIRHVPSGSELRLGFSEMSDGDEGGGRSRISPRAFDLEAVRKTMRAERVIDLDAPTREAGE
ncbi:MAG: hypothetical protein ACK5XK_13140 [Phycisphaerales bacterium]|nr:hypothetical protein [Phycisphaeraceae bacterium]